MKIFVVTPSCNQLDWLRCCVASVADQPAEACPHGLSSTEEMLQGSERMEIHHHVQDACSTDGTVDWLRQYEAAVGVQRSEDESQTTDGGENNPKAESRMCDAYYFSFSSEKDEGMYDAINRGWEKAPEDADILAHLNCDEQYLPGALLKIEDCFAKHPKDDVVFANMIVIDAEGDYVCHRRPLPPMPIHSRLFIPGFTCTTFQRRSVFFEKGCRFDTSWKNLGDVVWYLSLVRNGCRFRMLNEYTSLFADTGANLNLMECGMEERRRYYAAIPRWIKMIRPAALLHRRVRYALRMILSGNPSSYSLFLLPENPRATKQIEHPTCVWRCRRKWRNAMTKA